MAKVSKYTRKNKELNRKDQVLGAGKSHFVEVAQAYKRAVQNSKGNFGETSQRQKKWYDEYYGDD